MPGSRTGFGARYPRSSDASLLKRRSYATGRGGPVRPTPCGLLADCLRIPERGDQKPRAPGPDSTRPAVL
jgi:hypothetical protein